MYVCMYICIYVCNVCNIYVYIQIYLHYLHKQSKNQASDSFAFAL